MNYGGSDVNSIRSRQPVTGRSLLHAKYGSKDKHQLQS